MTGWGNPHDGCVCAEHFAVTGLAQMLALMARGHDQRTASLALWGWPSLVADYAAAAVDTAHAWRHVVDRLLAVLEDRTELAA